MRARPLPSLVPFAALALSVVALLAVIGRRLAAEDAAPPSPVGDDAKSYAEPLGEGKLEMAWIAGGTFMMGEAGGPTGTSADEGPPREVELDGFWIGKFEVTQAEWTAVMGRNPSTYKASLRQPVDGVSFREAREFCRKLSEKTGREYRLPTEAQWEYACRAGSTTSYSFGDDEARLGEFAWFHANSGHRTHEVGERKPNAWGLYDMHGNVWEWCADWMAPYGSGAKKNPAGPAKGGQRALRGGSWGYGAKSCRSACRSGGDPTVANSYGGFRVARIAAKK